MNKVREDHQEASAEARIGKSRSIGKPRLAILTNMLTPYRLAAYKSLGDKFHTVIMHGGTERNRTWQLEVPQSLEAKKVWTIQIPMRKQTGIPGIFDTAYVHLNLGLLWEIPRFAPSVIISHEMGLRTVIAIIYGMLTRTPVWVWWGGTVHSERNINKSRVMVRRNLARRVSRWISYGVTSTEYLESLGIERRQILQIQNCVPQTTFQIVPSKEPEWFKNLPRPIILTVGQLVERKGIDKLIEACGRLASNGAEFSLVIVGQGPERNRLQELANQSGIKHLEMLPNQPQSTLNEIYRSADAFVFPTLEDVWGLVVNEAMWTGTPVLCSKYAGCATELLPESNLFDPLCEESFDLALNKILDKSVSPPDHSKLKTCEEVSGLICHALQLGSPIDAAGKVLSVCHE